MDNENKFGQDKRELKSSISSVPDKPKQTQLGAAVGKFRNTLSNFLTRRNLAEVREDLAIEAAKESKEVSEETKEKESIQPQEAIPMQVGDLENTQIEALPDLEDDKIELTDVEAISKLPVLGEGNVKRIRLVELSDGNKQVIAEYKRPVTEATLRATTLQQNILHSLFPQRFVVEVNENVIGSDGIARLRMNYVEIDTDRAGSMTGPGASATASALHIEQIKKTPEFQSILPELHNIGFISTDEIQAISSVNELAGNTLFNPQGEQIIVDVVEPTYDQQYGDRNPEVLPLLNGERVLEMAREKGVEERVQGLVEEYNQIIPQAIKDRDTQMRADYPYLFNH